ncbi:MAG: LysR family transcriptional regulator ArgP [Humidesulfovibrio sp.]|uniref:LysR family transcriptional regulator ArgP n=1 Tax=Humidesulfovibrio sp. TaxID=2910988 RepID=UPI0027F96FD7|nr:LysR family transcriptional regulator ArgP [Humidesulfovibrio sp.]MDQ7834136.1 LysR family transcriptional regulator ArgP [Humidesulfovibrio sp.]
MIEAKHLETLTAVIEEGGFERAARRLNITQSAVSQRIRQMEEATGQPVLTRTQPPRPTGPGRALLRHARRVTLLEAELEAEMERLCASSEHADANGQPWQPLALAVNADTLATWLADAVLPVLASERIALDLRVDDQEKTLELLRNGEVSGCISARKTPPQGCRAEFLGHMTYHCACSPAFAQRWFADGLSLKAAWKAPAVVFNRDDNVHDSYLAMVLGVSPENAPRHHVPDSERFVDFVLGSAGYGLIPHLQAKPHFATGSLVDLSPVTMPVPLYWHCWNIPSRLLARMGKALKAEARKQLLPAP